MVVCETMIGVFRAACQLMYRILELDPTFLAENFSLLEDHRNRGYIDQCSVAAKINN